MKISAVKTFVADGGFRPWVFVKVETDDGLYGWGDCTDWGSPYVIVSAVERLAEYIIGEDPLKTEYIWQKLSKESVRHAFGITHKAMAGIDSALWDLKGKYLNVPVWQLLGGKLRDELRIYWTHFGWTRHNRPETIGKAPLKTPQDFALMCKEAKHQGITAVKTNLFPSVFGYDFSAIKTDAEIAGYATPAMIQQAKEQIAFLRENLGHDVDIALDVAFQFTTDGAIKLARELEPYNLMWLEAETFHADALKTLSNATKTTLCLGESLFGVSQLKPFIENQSVGIVMPDLAWNGISEGKRIADYAKANGILFSPHNCHSPLTTFISANLCAAIPNFYILEMDYDDVEWRDKIMTNPIEIKNGKMQVPQKPGFGSEPIEEMLLEYPAKRYFNR